MAQEDSEKVRASRKELHKELKQEQKEAAKRVAEDRQKQSAIRKGSHRGGGGR
jgi:hypothetical protein